MTTNGNPGRGLSATGGDSFRIDLKLLNAEKIKKDKEHAVFN